MCKKVIGYILIGIAGFVMSASGLGFTTWQFWVIGFCFILGDMLIDYE